MSFQFAIARVESRFHIVGFSNHLVPMSINPGMSLQDVTRAIDRVNWLIEKIR